MSNRQLGVPEQIAVALFKGIFKLIWAVIKAIVAAVSNASGRKSRAIYAPPPKGAPAPSTNAAPPPLPQTIPRPNLAEQPESDPRFRESDALADAGNFTEAVAALENITANGNETSELHFKLAQRNLALSERWSAAWAEPKYEDFSDTEECLAAKRDRDRMLSKPLRNGTNQIEERR